MNTHFRKQQWTYKAQNKAGKMGGGGGGADIPFTNVLRG